MPVLGHPSLEESYPSLANWSCTGSQAGWSKVGRSSTPDREISFVSSVAYGPKVSHSALAMGVYSFWNQAGWFPTINKIFKKNNFYSGQCAQWIEDQPAEWKVASSIPGQGTCLGCGPGHQLGRVRGNQLKFLSHINVSLPPLPCL